MLTMVNTKLRTN